MKQLLCLLFWACSFITLAQNTIARLQHHFCEDVGKLQRIFTFIFSFWTIPRYKAKAVCFQIVTLMTSIFSWVAIRPDLKGTFYLENDIGRKKSRFLAHSISQNISLVSPCDSFDALTASTAFVLATQLNHLAHSKKDCDWLV